MRKIIPHLWFDKEAKEAAEFYTRVFPNSKITYFSTLSNTPSGDVETVAFEISGMKFRAVSAGSHFKFNPSISFMVNFDPLKDEKAQKKQGALWDKLVDGGRVLMPLDIYPFSKRYGWVQDKYGVSWQLFLSDPESEKRPFIVPSLMFTGKVCGKADEALDFYTSVFSEAKRHVTVRYPKGMEPDEEGYVMFADFMIENRWFAAMDSARMHDFEFNEAISFIISCKKQKDIDYYWEKLSAVPEAEQCGWLKDQYGISWQIVPSKLWEMMQKGTPEQINRVTQAFLKMKKFNVKALKQAYRLG